MKYGHVTPSGPHCKTIYSDFTYTFDTEYYKNKYVYNSNFIS